MIPFPGESLGLWAASDVGGIGYDLGDLITNRDGSATLAAGDEWDCWVRNNWPDYLEDDTTPVVVSWVVEVLSGSVTASLSEGLVSDYLESGATPTGLGSVVLSTGTNVISSTITATEIFASRMLLRLVASSGSAVVQQVKLRVWPPEGVAGGWSLPYPEYDREAVPDQRYLSDTRNVAGEPGDIAAHLDEPVSIGTIGGVQLGEVFAESTLSGGVLTFVLQNTATIYTRDAADTYLPDIDSTLGLVEEVDYIRPPEEVYGDLAAGIDPLDSVTVNGWTNTTLQTDVTGTSGGHATFYAAAYPGDPASLDITWPDTAAGTSVTVPDVDQFYLASSHTWMTGATILPDIDEATTYTLGNGLFDFPLGGGPDFVGLRSLVTFPSYRVWNPAVSRIIPLRQYHRDDGLGVTPPRAYGGASRIRTGRAYGYD